MSKEWGTVRQTCETFSLGRVKLYALLKEGRISSAKVGRRRLINFQSVRAFLERSE